MNEEEYFEWQAHREEFCPLIEEFNADEIEEIVDFDDMLDEEK